MTTHKHYQLAYQAYSNISHLPEVRAKDECEAFDASIAHLQGLGVDQVKIDRYESLFIAHLQAKSRCMSSMITGPANFPVARAEKANKIEHKRLEELLDYYNKIIEEKKKETYYADNPDARPIMAGDEDAIERLYKKRDDLKALHADMILVNKTLRKPPIDRDALLRILKTEEKVQEVLKPSCFGTLGYERFQLTNNLAEIKRLEGRIKEIETRKSRAPKDFVINGVRVFENAETMRLQLFFSGKPSSDMITALKRNAFKWAPSVQAWQRQLTNNAVFAFNHYILAMLKEGETC